MTAAARADELARLTYEWERAAYAVTDDPIMRAILAAASNMVRANVWRVRVTDDA